MVEHDTTTGEGQIEKGQNDLDRLVEILNHPEKNILPLLYSNNDVSGDDKDGEKQKTLRELLDISKNLFSEIESMGKQYQELHEKGKALSRGSDENNNPAGETSIPSTTILSGLSELHIPSEMETTDTDLPETIFGQVDLQTTALAKLIKKSTKRLRADGKGDDGGICILDMGVMDSEDDELGDVNSDGHNDSDDTDDNDRDEENLSDGDDDVSDAEAERIRRRMERAMEDMEEEDEASDNEDDSDNDNEKQADSKKEEDLYDPVAEDMNDGFFDLTEMEEFADEEEDFLPNQAFGQPEDDERRKEKKGKNKKTFHQRQREGLNDDSDGEDSDDEDLDDMYEQVRDIKRKKYRDQEDIDALYELYQGTNPEDDNDDDDVVNMTAADFFGAPRTKYIERYKKNHLPRKKTEDMMSKDDDDSWGEYDFQKEDQEGWRDEENDDDDDDEEIEDMKEPAMGEAETIELEVPGRKNGDKKKLSKQEEKLRRQTDELEKELINEKPWQMRGESKSTSRPVNSLLEGTPEFEMASKQAPIITVQHTINLEDVIKQRILAEDWDDVVPRELPDIGWNKKRGEAPEVSQEKSKLGLGELYEREYLKKAVGYDKDAEEKQTEEDKAKDEMKQLFANLCSKLDALSNYHFAPRPIADEAEARAVTVPAIAMEEVLPLHVSDARGVAPEEVFATKRGRDGILRADHEMDQNDRKRQRQSKKAARRKARKEKEADEKLISRLQPGLGLNNPYEKRKAREELALARARGKVVEGERDMDAKFGSSGTFFKRLQAEAQQTVHDRSGQLDDHTEKKSNPRSSAYKL